MTGPHAPHAPALASRRAVPAVEPGRPRVYLCYSPRQRFVKVGTARDVDEARLMVHERPDVLLVDEWPTGSAEEAREIEGAVKRAWRGRGASPVPEPVCRDGWTETAWLDDVSVAEARADVERARERAGHAGAE